MTDVVVIKLNPEGRETWRYSGRILGMSQNTLLLEAYFNRPDMLFHDMPLRHHDRFVEAYFSDRWYNIFEIYDREDGNLKGWYCNVTAPAVFQDGVVSYVDLALDLLVFPDGRKLVLDEDEFLALALNPEMETKAREALADLEEIFRAPGAFSLRHWPGLDLSTRQ